MPLLKPFRQIDEHDSINGLFAFQGAVPAYAGTLVKVSSGFLADQHSLINGAPGASYANVTSPYWTVPAKVGTVTASGDQVVGILADDVRWTDENGEKLVFNPNKATCNNWVISGQASNIITKGQLMYSGIEGTPALPAYVYSSGNGELVAIVSSATVTATRVGKLLSPVVNKTALIKVEL